MFPEKHKTSYVLHTMTPDMLLINWVFEHTPNTEYIIIIYINKM